MKGRLTYIDWMRGLACLLMFQTHVYDSWTAPAYRNSTFIMYSQALGTFPAPLFIFLAGFSLALGMDRMTERGATSAQISVTFARRGLEIFGLGVLFRVQQFAMSWGWAPWTDLLRVDVLNMIGLSLMCTGLVAMIATGAWRRAAVAAVIAAIIALLTPPLFTTWKPDFLPWWLASYVNGGHTDYQPKGYLFPIFPWMGFAFGGCAAGLVVMRARSAGREAAAVAALAVGGAALALLSRWLDHLPGQFYAVYDYWRTSPNFFLARLGLLLVILGFCYLWCAIKPGKWWSPVEQLGSTSLLVYWVHIEFVYGRLTLLPKKGSSLEMASGGLLLITAMMVVLSLLKTRWSARGKVKT